jgi:hypothetical protein
MADYQQQYFQKSTSMRFAKLIEHPSKFSYLIILLIKSLVRRK